MVKMFLAGLFLQDDAAAAAYSTLEQTQHSSNPNVYFQVSLSDFQ